MTTMTEQDRATHEAAYAVADLLDSICLDFHMSSFHPVGMKDPDLDAHFGERKSAHGNPLRSNPENLRSCDRPLGQDVVFTAVARVQVADRADPVFHSADTFSGFVLHYLDTFIIAVRGITSHANSEPQGVTLPPNNALISIDGEGRVWSEIADRLASTGTASHEVRVKFRRPSRIPFARARADFRLSPRGAAC